MLTALDIMTGKILVQLNLASVDDTRNELRNLDQGKGDTTRDLVNRLTDLGKLDAKAIELVRHRGALYEHVRAEASYLRLLERHSSISKTAVAKLIAELERHAFRRRLGDVLVRDKTLTKDQDRSLSQRMRQMMEKDDAAIIERYRREDFSGVAKPLMPGRKLEPEDFKISTLFRSKETRALVDKAELEALRAEAAQPPATVEITPPEEKTPEQAPKEHHHHHHKHDTAKQKKDGEGTAVGMDRVRTMKRIADYTIVELLGAGGMGAVFLGQKAGAYEFVAIKVMLNQAASDAERGRFQREIKLTKNVKHKNVIGILDSGQTSDGLTFLVVPALAGKELRALIDHAGGEGLDPLLACDIFEQMLDAMQAVHEARIVHRDLKPENIFVLAGGHEVKIMDFGLAKLDEEADKEDSKAAFRTMSGEVVGSPAYIAPECISCDPIDGRTDIYALGVVFFEMLTGKRPIESETTQGYLTSHLIEPPLTLKEARGDRMWATQVEDLFKRMLGKTRDERPASCKVILDEIRGGLRERILAAGAPIPPTATGEPPREEPPKVGFRGLLGRLWGRA